MPSGTASLKSPLPSMYTKSASGKISTTSCNPADGHLQHVKHNQASPLSRFLPTWLLRLCRLIVVLLELNSCAPRFTLWCTAACNADLTVSRFIGSRHT